MFTWLILLANGDPQPIPPPDALTQWQPLFMIGIAMLFFYFILLRPEQKRRKEMETKRSALRKGDRVTAMGIIGTVSKITENTVVLKMVDGTKIEFVKAAITEVLPGNEEDAGGKVEVTEE